MMIVISAWKEEWNRDYRRLEREIREALGDIALSIDHIGSTSVHNLGAKDIIDIQVTVESLTDEIIGRMTENGFTYMSDIQGDHVPKGEREDAGLWTKQLYKQKNGERASNIHVRKLGNPNQKYALLFRDYLRAHEHIAQTIFQIKRELAKHFPEDVDAYYAIKDPVYDIVWGAAREWEKGRKR